jgi:hypothetical protein
MQHFTRLRFAAGTLALSALAAGCGSSPVTSFTANPAFQQQTQPNPAAAKQAAQQNLRNDLVALKKDARTLAGEDTISLDLSTLASDYGNEQQDWQSEQSDGCSSVAADEGLVAWDAQSVSRDAAGLQTDLTGLQSGNVAAVTNDLSDVHNDLSALKLLGITPQVTTSAEVAAGNKVLNSANDAINAAYATGASTSARAQRLLVNAQNWAKKHAC